MKPRETGGNMPRRRQQPSEPVLAALLQSHTEHQGQAPIPPAPTKYDRMGSNHLADFLAPVKPHGRLNDREQETEKRNRYAAAHFPYTNEAQVGYANASGDIERNVLPRAALIAGGTAPSVHPGDAENPATTYNSRLPSRRAGYAFRGRNDIWLTPDAYMDSPGFTRDVALHEFSHTRQPSRAAPISQVEGGADWLAAALAEQLHMPEYRPGYPQYAKRFRKMAPGDALRAALLR